MITLDKEQTKQRIDETEVQSKKFDERLGISLSNGILIEDKEADAKDFRQASIKEGVLINQEYFQERIKNELTSLKGNPNNSKILNRVGDIYFANLKFDKAKTYFKRALALNTENIIIANKLTQTYMALGKVHLADQVLDLVTVKKDSNTLHLHAVIKMVLNKLSESEDLIKEIPPEAFNHHEAINTLGIISLLRQDYPEAEKCFLQSIKDNKAYVPAQNNLAVAYQNENRTEEAIKQYKHVTSLDPTYLVAYNNLFSLLVHNKRINEAHDVMVSAHHLSNKENDIQFRIAWTLMHLEKYDDAIKEYEKVLELLPENSNTLNNIGFCYVQLNNATEAIDSFGRALLKERNNVLPLKNLMEVYEMLGRQKDSRELAARLLRLAPNEPSALVFVADGYAEKEEWHQALRLYEIAYKSKPVWTSLYIGLTQIYADISPDLKKGIEVAKFAIDNKLTNHERVCNNLVHLYLVNNKIDEAEEWLARLADDNSISLATKGLYYLKKKNVKKAKELFLRAKSLGSGTYRDKVVQREAFDLGNYYLEANDHKKAFGYFDSILKDSDKGYKYICASTREIINSLND